MKGRPVIKPVYLTATYQFDRSDDLIEVVQNRNGYLYSRWDNPSVMETEQMLAELEGYDRALGFGSGMAAISTAVLANVEAGCRIVAMRELYGGTFELFNDIMARLDVQTVFINCWDTEKILEEIDHGLSILYLETPTNPLLRVVDVKPLARAAHKKGALVLLD
jgi:cystathionine beta-lyase/cystathionine gamma-synthase